MRASAAADHSRLIDQVTSEHHASQTKKVKFTRSKTPKTNGVAAIGSQKLREAIEKGEYRCPIDLEDHEKIVNLLTWALSKFPYIGIPLPHLAMAVLAKKRPPTVQSHDVKAVTSRFGAVRRHAVDNLNKELIRSNGMVRLSVDDEDKLNVSLPANHRAVKALERAKAIGDRINVNKIKVTGANRDRVQQHVQAQSTLDQMLRMTTPLLPAAKT